jgi:dienelactone hydrolase
VASFLALLAFLRAAGLHVERVSVPGPNDVSLDAALVLPAGEPKAPPILAMHGCGGPFPVRDAQWAGIMANAGHAVLLPDSFGSRGLGSQCASLKRPVTAEGLRRQDAIASARWLIARAGPSGKPSSGPPGVPPLGTSNSGVVLMGWSNGGSTVLATARAAPDLPAGLFLRFVAFYPGCAQAVKDPGWKASAKLLLLIGESDDWTPAQPCHELASRDPNDISLIGYPGAYHEFDAPNRPVKSRSGTSTSSGSATVGTNEPARQDALRRVPIWVETGRLESPR